MKLSQFLLWIMDAGTAVSWMWCLVQLRATGERPSGPLMVLPVYYLMGNALGIVLTSLLTNMGVG